MTTKGGYTRQTVEGWGIQWPPKRGWLKELKKKAGDKLTEPPVANCKLPESKQTILIEFDGGSTCNVPSRGYGIGYGSYRIDEGEIQTWNEGRNMSANAGEIFTLAAAVNTVAALHISYAASLNQVNLQIRGDSKIALKWARQAKVRNPHIPTSGSPEFREAIGELWKALKPFRSVRADWWPRENSVRIFGH